MSRFERSDISLRRGIPLSLKIIAVFAVVMLIGVRSCSHKADANALKVGVVTIEESTPVSAEITFPIRNDSKKYYEHKKVLIKLYLQDGTVFKDKLAEVTILPKSEKTYRFVLEKFDRALRPDEKITAATVEFFHTSFQ
jgi:hypothetical protein